MGLTTMTTRMPPRPATTRLLQSLIPLLTIICGIAYLASLSVSYVSAAPAAPVTPGTTTGGEKQQSSTAQPSTSPPTHTPVAYPTVKGLKGGRECSRDGDGPWAAVAANSTTSCPFANNVREAYIKSDLNGADGTVQAWSPATKLNYNLTCFGSQPAVCVGGRNARIQIYGGTYLPG